MKSGVPGISHFPSGAFASGMSKPAFRIAAEKLLQGNALRPDDQAPCVGIAASECRPSRCPPPGAAFDLNGPNGLSAADHVIHFGPPLSPVGHGVLHGSKRVAQAGPHGVFHQPAPPPGIGQGGLIGVRGEGIDQRVAPENQRWAAAAFSLLVASHFKTLETASPGRLPVALNVDQPNSCAGFSLP